MHCSEHRFPLGFGAEVVQRRCRHHEIIAVLCQLADADLRCELANVGLDRSYFAGCRLADALAGAIQHGLAQVHQIDVQVWDLL